MVVALWYLLVHRAYHRAPLECGDGAGDGPRKASAVTSPVYAGRQDPAKNGRQRSATVPLLPERVRWDRKIRRKIEKNPTFFCPPEPSSSSSHFTQQVVVAVVVVVVVLIHPNCHHSRTLFHQSKLCVLIRTSAIAPAIPSINPSSLRTSTCTAHARTRTRRLRVVPTELGIV